MPDSNGQHETPSSNTDSDASADSTLQQTQVISSSSEQDDPLIGVEVNHYLIKERIGQGGMGQVYLAWDKDLDREVALKFLPEYLTADTTAVERLIREAKASAKLEHSNIVSILGIGDQNGRHYITMQYVEGGTLDEVLNQQGVLEVQESLRILRQAANGLLAAHQMGIIHRDVKPENIMLDRYNTVKISDFGLAISNTQTTRLTMDGQIVGTPYIMSPEQCDGKELDMRSDIYSLGITFFKMLTGKWPFDAETAVAIILKQLQKPLPDPLKYKDDIPEQVIAIVKRMTAKVPEDRYQNLQDLLQDIDAISDVGVSSLSTQTSLSNKKKNYLRRILIGLLLLIACYAIYLKLLPDNEIDDKGVATVVKEKEGDAIISHDEAISRCQDKIYQCALKITDPKWVKGNENTIILSELYEYNKNIELLKNLDPNNEKIKGIETDYIESKRKIETDIAYEVIGKIDNRSSIDSSIKYIDSLDKQVLDIQRVSNHVFAKYIEKIETLLKKSDDKSFSVCLDMLNKLWGFNVAYEIKAQLLEYESTLRKFQTDSMDATLDKKRRGYVYQKNKYAKSFVENDLDVDNAILLFQSSLEDAKYLKDKNAENMSVQFYLELSKDYKHWSKYKEFRDRFNASLENTNNFVYEKNSNVAEYTVSRQILNDWQAFDDGDEIKRSRERLEYKESIEEGARAEKDKNYLRAYHAYVRALDIKHQDVMATNAKLRIKKELDGDLLLPTIESINIEIKKGHFKTASTLLDNAEDLAKGNDESLEMIAKIRKKIYEIDKSLENINELMKKKKWMEAIIVLEPLLEKYPLPESQYNISVAYQNVSENYVKEAQWELAYKNIVLAIKYQSGNDELVGLKKTIIDAWVNETIKSLSELETSANNLIATGDIDKAIEVLSNVNVVHPELNDSKVVASILKNISSRREELGVYDDWIKKIVTIKNKIDKNESDDWKTCLAYLKEAEKIGSQWDVFKKLNKSTLFDKAKYVIKHSNDERAVLEAYWEKWLNRPDDDATSEKELEIYRKKMAYQKIFKLKKNRLTFIDRLEKNDYSQCSAILGNSLKVFSEIKVDFDKIPKLEELQALTEEEKIWGDYSAELNKQIQDKKNVDEKLKKYNDFLTLALSAKEAGNYKKSLDNLKNALAHATADDSVIINKEIIVVKKMVDNYEQIQINKKKDADRRKLVQNMIVSACVAEKKGDWAAALKQVEKFSTTSLPKDADLIPNDKIDLITWKGRLNLLLEDQKAFDELLLECQSLEKLKAKEFFERFIRLNQGNYYVIEKHVQNEIDKLNNVTDMEYKKYKYSILKKHGELDKNKKYEESRELIKKALDTHPSESDFHKALITTLQNDRCTFTGGDFVVGSEKGEGVESQELPAHTQTIKPFSLSKFEVTNIEWLYFVKALKLDVKLYWTGGESYVYDNLLKPIHNVSYKDAIAYAKYISDGARLPTEFEWEYAARSGSTEIRRWPWGNTEDKTKLNISGTLSNVDSLSSGVTTNSIYNMAGNVAEWTSSEYKSYPSTNILGQKVKPKMLIKDSITVRGGSIYSDLYRCRTTSRQGVKKGSKKLEGIGLRLCWD